MAIFDEILPIQKIFREKCKPNPKSRQIFGNLKRPGAIRTKRWNLWCLSGSGLPYHCPGSAGKIGRLINPWIPHRNYSGSRTLTTTTAELELTMENEIPCEVDCESESTSKIPCQKPALHNVIPFRPGNSRAGEKEATFPQLEWSYSEPERTVYTCQDFAFKSSRPIPTMAVRCRRFVPRPSDVLVEPCEASDGEIIFVQSPPFACVLLPP